MSNIRSYRGKDLRGRWFVGNLTIVPKDTANHKAGYYISNSAGMPFAYAVRPDSVGQQLDRKDINNKPIFEGDRLKIEIKHYSTGRIIADGESVVEYRDDCYGVVWGYQNEFTPLNSFVYTTFEVIGNIHDQEDGQ